MVGQKDEALIKCRYLGTGLSGPYNEVSKARWQGSDRLVELGRI